MKHSPDSLILLLADEFSYENLKIIGFDKYIRSFQDKGLIVLLEKEYDSGGIVFCLSVINVHIKYVRINQF